MKKFLITLTIILFAALGACSLSPTTSTQTTIETTTTATSAETQAPTTTQITTETTTTTASPTTDLPTTALTTITTEAPVTTTISTQRYVTLEIYGMNDFHGGAYTDVTMISKIGQYLMYRKSVNENTIILAHGDMLQGSALSNYYYGLPLIEAMNVIGFDGFTIGNHEFDWGIDVIGDYKDGDPDNGEAEYPILAANIVYTDSQAHLPWTEPYTVIDINGIRVGVIGVIGDVINSISASRVENISFLVVVETVESYAAILRTEELCDIVIVSVHEYNSWTNNQLSTLTGNSRIDAIFNGHSHTSVAGKVFGTNVPFAQASNYANSLLTKISLVFDNQTKTIISSSAEIISESQLSAASTDIDTLLNVFASVPEYESFINYQLAIAQYDFGRSALAPWGASVIRDYAGVDFGMTNAGGFRVTMASGAVTNGDLVVIYPFDNVIKTCQMSGQQLTYFYENVANSGYDVIFDDQVSYSGGVLYKDGIPVVLSQMYSVGAVDYIFDKTYYAFLSGQNITTTAFMMRDLLANDLENTSGQFNPANGTSFSPVQPVTHYFDISLFKSHSIMI